MLEVVCMKWGPAYGAGHVNALDEALARNLSQPFRLTCFTDDPSGIAASVRTLPLPETVKGAPMAGRFRRYIKLWLYSDEMRQLIGARFMFLDLDVVICGPLDHIAARKDPILFWADPAQHTPYNSSLVLMDAGARSEVWEKFDPATSPKLCDTSRIIGHDQCWAGIVLGPNEATVGAAEGVYSMRNDIMRGAGLPDNACLVVFHGKRDPSDPKMQVQYPWIVANWRPSGRGRPPKDTRPLIVLGGAQCVKSDMAALKTWFPGERFDVAACNDAGTEFPHDLVLWATLHPEHMARWRAARSVAGLPRPRLVVGARGGDGYAVDRGVPRRWNGSSGLYTAQVAHEILGYRRVVLCGVPMDDQPNRYRDETSWRQHKSYREGWALMKRHAPEFADCLRSMSGWTAELLGQPDGEWLRRGRVPGPPPPQKPSPEGETE